MPTFTRGHYTALLSRIEPKHPTAGETKRGEYSAQCCTVRAADTPQPPPTCMVIQHTQHMNTSYPRKFSTNNIICILYFNMGGESHN